MGQLVVAGGDGSPLLESVEAAFDDVASSVDVGVKGGWSAASGAASVPQVDLVDPLGTGVSDAAAPQCLPSRGVGVRPVAIR